MGRTEFPPDAAPHATRAGATAAPRRPVALDTGTGSKGALL
jgi:hypothetical protein